MKSKNMKKSVLLVLSLAIILMAAVGGTMAWLAAGSDEVINTFIPAQVSCAVDESFKNGVKSDVRIKNTSDIAAYIRAAVVVNWADEDGNIYGAPVSGGDYTMVLDNTDWFEAGGYYYHKASVAPDGFTGILIASCTETAGKAPEGYRLQVSILAEAIQAAGKNGEGVAAIATVWPVEVIDGTLAARNG